MHIPHYFALRFIREDQLGPLYSARNWAGRRVYIRVIPRRLYDERRLQQARERLRRIRGIAAPIDGGILDDRSAYVVSAGVPAVFHDDWNIVIAVIAIAHDRDVVHGHLSSGSLLYDEHGRVLVLDFGLSSVPDQELFRDYPAERRDGRLQQQSDQYALGMLMIKERAKTSDVVVARATNSDPKRRFESTWEMVYGAEPQGSLLVSLTSWSQLQLAAHVVGLYPIPIGAVVSGGGVAAFALIRTLTTIAAPERTIHDAYFNTWFESREVETPQIVETLEKKEPYWFAFDVSRVAYEIQGATSWVPSAALKKEIESAVQSGHNKLQLVVRPVLVGRGITFPQVKSPMQLWRDGRWTEELFESGDAIALEIDVTKFRSATTVPLDPSPANDEARAGGLRLPFFATDQPGCAAIALSFWLARSSIPLDHLVAYVPVGGGRCPSAPRSRVATDNFLGSLVAPSDVNPAAALHLFSLSGTGPDVNTVAVYAAPAGLRAGCDHYSWPTRLSVAELIAIATPEEIGNGRTSEHQSLAGRLAYELFPVGDGRCEAGAALALAHLREVTKQPGQIVFARAVDPSKQAFLPLSLVFALREKNVPAFANRPIIVQPLPRTSYGAGKACMADFAYALPRKLERVSNPIILPADLKYLEQTQELKREQAAFKDYMGTKQAAMPERGTLLLILAHHGNGELYFDDSHHPWTASGFGRDFAPGSVAVLVACSVATKPADSGAIVTELNKRNFDAEIVAPFDVPVETGVKLAMNFARGVEKARHDRATPTVAELFDDAVNASLKDLNTKQDQAAVREFFLAGNGGLRLCAQPSP